jgi:hypothetical protein
MRVDATWISPLFGIGVGRMRDGYPTHPSDNWVSGRVRRRLCLMFRRTATERNTVIGPAVAAPSATGGAALREHRRNAASRCGGAISSYPAVDLLDDIAGPDSRTSSSHVRLVHRRPRSSAPSPFVACSSQKMRSRFNRRCRATSVHSRIDLLHVVRDPELALVRVRQEVALQPRPGLAVQGFGGLVAFFIMMTVEHVRHRLR